MTAAGDGGVGPAATDAAGVCYWRDLGANPIAAPFVVAQNYTAGGGRPAIAPPAAGTTVCGLTTDLVRYLLAGQLPVNSPAAAPPLPVYPGENGIRPSKGLYVVVVVPSYIQKFTQEEVVYLAYALSGTRVYQK